MRTKKIEVDFSKTLLIIQSFFPLAVLLLIKYGNIKIFDLCLKFGKVFAKEPIYAIGKTIEHADLCLVMLHVFCVIIILFSVVGYLLLSSGQKYGFVDKGEKILIEEDTTEMSVGFFVTYITPMLMDGIDQKRGFLCFILVFIIMVLLMMNTNLYYQNPVLVIIGYRTFKFCFNKENNEEKHEDNDKETFVAITRGEVCENKIILRKKVSDDVFIIYNKN